MNRRTGLVSLLIILATTATALALSPGTDILVGGAGRGGPWITDLYVLNPNATSVQVEIFWLVRDQANPNPQSVVFDLLPGEMLALEDVIFEEFGLTSGKQAAGAFRVVADSEVIVNSRIFAAVNGQTFGQGFEGIPTWAATSAGQSTDVVGLTKNSQFRTNIYALAGPNGADIDLSLRDPSGSELDSATLELDQYEPFLDPVEDVFSAIQNFDNASLRATVNSGLAVVGASKADQQTDDPSTLESVASGGGGSIDGIYQVAFYDEEGFAAGGNIVIQNGLVTAVNGTYFNFMKGGDPTNPDCALVFLWGLTVTPRPVEDYQPASGGVTFDESFPDSGTMSWSLQFNIDNNLSITGSLGATGSDFPSDPDPNFDQSGCNGQFPDLDIFGGKTSTLIKSQRAGDRSLTAPRHWRAAPAPRELAP